MWIKWKYMDHGWRDWEEIEIPDDLGGWEDVPDYLIEERPDLNIPTWSERYMKGRIYWEKLELPPEELHARTLKRLKAAVASAKRNLEYAESELAKFTKA